MSNFYKNIIDYSYTPNPTERRKNLSDNIAQYGDLLPQPVSYEDIDLSFKEWVEKEVSIVQDGIELPTMVLYSNQRFSEYLQTWRYTDENNNIRLNFKTVTRNANPVHGTIIGDTYNVPGNRFYTVKSIEATDDNGKRYRLDYKMRQPTAVDFTYKISIMTNRYITLNEFNETIHQLFNARQNYICPKGHYMPITIENISDESEYNIEDRQFFSQNFTAKVRGYIIKENDFKVEENPMASIICFEGDTAKRRKPTIDLYEYDPCYNEEDGYYKKTIEIDIDLSFCYPCKGKTKFTMDEDFTLTQFNLKEPINIVKNEVLLYVNDILISKDLYADAYEGYKLCEKTPEDATEYNTLITDTLFAKKQKKYKYILHNNEYYFWHQIHFLNGDEIRIETKRVNRYINTGGFVLVGYNRFLTKSVFDNPPETSIDLKNDKYQTTILNIEPLNECIK